MQKGNGVVREVLRDPLLPVSRNSGVVHCSNRSRSDDVASPWAS